MDANELTPEKNMEFNNEEGNANDVIEARPISFKNPDSNTIYTIENEKLTMEERKVGWIEQPRKRPNGRADKYYYHLKSNEMCRSLVEVHDFIKNGIPIRSLKKMKKKQDESPAKKIRGSSLLKKTVVGTYNFQTKMIYQLEAPAVIEENPQPPLDNLVHPENEDNEMEENPMAEGETIIRQVNKSKDATSSAPHGGANVPYINFDFL